MSERLLAGLLQQALLLSVAVLLMAALRPLLLKRLGAGSVYAAWLLAPALLLTPLLPRPAQEPLRVMLQAAGSAETVATPVLPAPPLDQTAIWLALWLGGASLVAAVQAQRQWRLSRRGRHLPAGSSPALVGLLRPHVALPVDFEQRFSPAERELILAHEQVHRDRLDNLWNLLACAMTALHWWNPLAWWAGRRMQADQELACDAAVLATRPCALADYTGALLAAHDLKPHGAPVASRWGHAHPLLERIAMLKNPELPSRRRAILMAGSLTACASLVWAGQAGPAPVEGPAITLSLVIAQQVGERVNRLSLALAGRQGERMRLDTPGDGSDANPPLALDLTARITDNGQVMIESVIWEGRPLSEVARPRLLVNMNQPAMVEHVDAAANHRISLVIVASRFDAR